MSEVALKTRGIASKRVASGKWLKETLSDFWEINAQRFPNREAIITPSERLTWSQANLQATRVALGLQEIGFERDDILVIQLPNCADAFILRAACDRAGIIYAVPQVTLGEREMKFVLSETAAKGAVIPYIWRRRDFYQMLLEMRPTLPHLKHVLISGDRTTTGGIAMSDMRRKPLEKKYPFNHFDSIKHRADEAMMLVLTGGTTGVPKLIESPTNARLTIFREAAKRFGAHPDDVIGVTYHHPVGPLSHAYQIAPQFGIKVALLGQEKFEPGKVFRFIQREKVTWLPLVPTLLVELIESPHVDDYLKRFDISSLRIIVTGGAPLPLDVAEKAEEKLHTRIVNFFGMTEGVGFCSSVGDPQHIRLGTVGRPFEGDEVKLIDGSGNAVLKGSTGELLIRPSLGVSAYYNKPEATRESWTEDGWFTTGDIAKSDEKGNIVIVGRKKDMIIRGGQNIYPGEIEEILQSHPKVADVAILGIPDSVMGEKACAFVVPKKGKDFSFEEMCAFLKEQKLAMFKIPEKLKIIDAVPRVGEAGKANKILLRQIMAAKAKPGLK